MCAYVKWECDKSWFNDNLSILEHTRIVNSLNEWMNECRAFRLSEIATPSLVSGVWLRRKPNQFWMMISQCHHMQPSPKQPNHTLLMPFQLLLQLRWLLQCRNTCSMCYVMLLSKITWTIRLSCVFSVEWLEPSFTIQASIWIPRH